jgi:hypothetical protein
LVDNEFTTCDLKSYVTFESEVNTLDLHIVPSTTITTAHSLIIEFPTKTINDVLFFDDDLGTGLNSFDAIPFDLTSYNYITSMSCILIKGDNTVQLPAKIVCSNFNTDITPTKHLRFAFEVTNPTLQTDDMRFIPITIYSYDPLTLKKTNWNHLIDSFFVTDSNYFAATTPATTYTPTSLQFMQYN